MIRFTEITGVVEETLQHFETVECPDIEEIFDADAGARRAAEEIIRGKKK